MNSREVIAAEIGRAATILGLEITKLSVYPHRVTFRAGKRQRTLNFWIYRDGTAHVHVAKIMRHWSEEKTCAGNAPLISCIYRLLSQPGGILDPKG